MSVLDFQSKMMKLSEVATAFPSDQVFVWRKVLSGAWQEGFDAGYLAAMQDRSVENVIARKENRDREQREPAALDDLARLIFEAGSTNDTLTTDDNGRALARILMDAGYRKVAD
ncbi:hypothetical protein ACQP25_44960 (plasmid) [Microtetraspora malaysiensis]|uniref:hypothetical protein n=1 Tax=Microtetraspora malaysiensis TaxID=161358 RepID=UPI003D8FA604